MDRYASPSNTTCVRFNALFDSVNVEGVNALTQDWRSSVSFVLPNFHELDAILDIIERDDARVVLILSCWPRQSWFRRLHSAAWAGRIAAWERISGAALMPNTTDCFFGDRFTTDLPVFFVPPLMGGMVLATSKRTKDRKVPLGAYPSWPEGRVWW